MVDEPKEPPDSPSVEPGKPEMVPAPGSTRPEKQNSTVENGALSGTPDAGAELHTDIGKAGRTPAGDRVQANPAQQTDRTAERPTSAEWENPALWGEEKSRIEAAKKPATATTTAEGSAQPPRPPVKKK